jgi:hypothetical protein
MKKKKSLKSVLLAKAEGVEIGDREVDKFVFLQKKRIRITFSANQTLFGHSELFVHSLFNAICFQFELEVLIFVERSLRLKKHFLSFFFRSATIH